MRKKEEEAQENVERWMLTYLDMITLLMAFFCILYAFSQVDAVKFKQVAQSMSLAFGTGTGSMIGNNSGSGVSQMTDSLLTLRENNQFKEMIKLIREYAAKQGISNSVKYKITERGLEVDFSSNVLFLSGKADLSSEARKILDDLGKIYLENNNEQYIQVEGHTDNVPIHNEKYQSNWQLSTDRATNVIMYWISKYPDRAKYLSAAGYGEYREAYPNNTEEGRAKNRRIKVILLRSRPGDNPVFKKP
jgi:chemotaxis protein MotB